MLELQVKSNGTCSLATMLHLDFASAFGRHGGMDDDTAEIIAQLCTRIGMIMEDASVVALTIGSLAGAERVVAIAELEAAADQISALVGAAKALTA